MSADSGLPVFAALSNHPAMRDRGLTYDQIASPDMLVKGPETFYGFWLTCRSNYLEAVPHQGYAVIKRWMDRLPSAASLCVTSNVDGFIQRAGVPDANVAQIHGQCVGAWQCGGVPNRERPHFPLYERDGCGALFEPALDGLTLDRVNLRATPSEGGTWPTCPSCGGAARPNVYLFGDGSRFRDDARVTKHQAWTGWKAGVLAALKSDPSRKLVVVEVGCGLRIPSIRKRGEELCAAAPVGQCDLVRINPQHAEQYQLVKPTIVLPSAGEATLVAIDQEMRRLAPRVGR